VAAAAIACWMLSAAGGAQQPPRYVERVDVSRILIDVRVLDDAHQPVRGLAADDFTVKIDGKRAPVDSAMWVGAGEPEADAPASLSSPPRPDEGAPERLIVFLFQKSLEPSRIVGLMRMLNKGRTFLSTLTHRDRVAILSFDSHLKIWTDFTSDRARLEPVLRRGVLLERPPAVQAGEWPSLVARLEPAQGKRTYSIEKALQLIGEALEPLPGSKSLVLFGYGMGRFSRNGVSMEAGYEAARRALIAARTSVFSLDVTEADYHSLEVGLQLLSDQTGGFYARTHIFPDLAMHSLAGALAGYYVLFVENPQSRRATHDLDVQLTRRKGTVLARSRYEG